MALLKYPFYLLSTQNAVPIGDGGDTATYGVDGRLDTFWRAVINVPEPPATTVTIQSVAGYFSDLRGGVLSSDLDPSQAVTLVVTYRTSTTTGTPTDWRYVNFEFPYAGTLDFPISWVTEEPDPSTWETIRIPFSLSQLEPLIDTDQGFITHTKDPYYSSVFDPPAAVGQYILDVAECYVEGFGAEVEPPTIEATLKRPVGIFVAGRR